MDHVKKAEEPEEYQRQLIIKAITMGIDADELRAHIDKAVNHRFRLLVGNDEYETTLIKLRRVLAKRMLEYALEKHWMRVEMDKHYGG